MASVDIFGKPISGDQHSKFFKSFFNSDGLTNKQLYEKEKVKLDQRKQDAIYSNKLKEAKDANRKFTINKIKHFFK